MPPKGLTTEQTVHDTLLTYFSAVISLFGWAASALEFHWQQSPEAKMQMEVGINELGHSVYLNLSLKSPMIKMDKLDKSR